MTMQKGTLLGPYEIAAPLGAGGMGEVYRARDTRLDRMVAIKVLPAHLSSDPERRQRLEREARAVSSLSHPHICQLFDIGEQDGINFLVMEYIEGETLDARLSRSALPLEEAMRYAVQIADALDKAHRQGVVHRDLKPGNIMLTTSGAKLLDFGLAKFSAKVSQVEAGATALPTQNLTLTSAGMILGTFQYMAPEQLEGKEADGRGDIFAFGAVLYEMLTGKKAFEGTSQATLIAAVMEHDIPALAVVAPMAPSALEHVIRRCLAKNPEDRFQSARDLLLELRWSAEAGSQAGVPAPVAARRRSRERLAWILLAALLIPFAAAVTLSILHLRETPETRAVSFQVLAPERTSFRFYDMPVISPDGRMLTFSGLNAANESQLWIRPIDSLTAQPLANTEGAYYPFWSPDGRNIAFFSRGRLMKIAVTGGPAQMLCQAQTSTGGSWNRDGVIIFSTWTGPLKRISAAGGDPKPLTTLDTAQEEAGHRWPRFLPDGRHFLYFAESSAAEKRAIKVGTLEGETKRLIASETAASYSPPGYLLFSRGDALVAQPFDADKLTLAGDPFPVLEHVSIMGGERAAAFSVSTNGVLSYRTGDTLNKSQIIWFDRGGKQMEVLGRPAEYTNPALSPDGKQLAVGILDAKTATRDLWIFDLARGSPSRFTFDPADDLNPTWSPDGKQLFLSSNRKGQRDIYRKVSSGAGAEELLFESKGVAKSLDDCSPDGRFLIYDTTGLSDLWILPLTGDRKPFPLTQTPFDDREARFSPDGKWIAYSSNESGNYEIYVRSFPDSGGRWQVSTGGGRQAMWRGDGREIYYLENSRKMMAADVDLSSGSFKTGIPRPLFDVRPASNSGKNTYVVTRDGQRFLISCAIEETNALPFTVVLNWTAALKH